MHVYVHLALWDTYITALFFLPLPEKLNRNSHYNTYTQSIRKQYPKTALENSNRKQH